MNNILNTEYNKLIQDKIICKNSILLHLGLIKTGSTWLQQEVFSKIENTNIISNEKLSGFNYYERFGILLFLKYLYPDAKILLILRNKDDWLKSCYAQFIRDGGFLKYQQWINSDFFDFELLKFNKYVDFIKSLFNDVLILNFKLFKEDKEKFVKLICDFINVPIPSNIDFGKRYNYSYYGRLLEFHRKLNVIVGYQFLRYFLKLYRDKVISK